MHGNADFKRGPLGKNTINVNRCPMRLRNPPCYRQAQPGACFPRARFIRAVKPLENEWQILWRYADSGVANLSDGIVGVCL
jgi:hypothetical protein